VKFLKKAVFSLTIALLAVTASAQIVTIGGQDTTTDVPWKYLSG
jgi:hypothetical protein